MEHYLSLGEALKQAKNFTYKTQTDIVNNRKFTLLGDPALTLAYPKYRVQTTTINGNAITATPDTLKALQKYSIGGNVSDAQGNILSGFNGTVYATVSDKANHCYHAKQMMQIVTSKISRCRDHLFSGAAQAW